MTKTFRHYILTTPKKISQLFSIYFLVHPQKFMKSMWGEKFKRQMWICRRRLCRYLLNPKSFTTISRWRRYHHRNHPPRSQLELWKLKKISSVPNWSKSVRRTATSSYGVSNRKVMAMILRYFNSNKSTVGIFYCK